jgi:hydrogenase expression/formation protein HypE
LSRLPLGKIPIEILNEVVFKNLGAKRKELALGPSAGVDGAVLNVGNKSIVTSMDPITGAIDRLGWLSLNINANDVATFGVQPAFYLSCIMLPQTADRKTVETITSQIDTAAKNMGIAVIGGHCEVTPQLKNAIVVGCAIGLTEKGKYVTAVGAQNGDKLILTKSAGLEGTAILATDREPKAKKFLNAAELRRARKFYDRISVVADAMTAYKTGAVDAMHDPTEGGVAGGANEIAYASKLGVRVYEERIRVEAETTKICEAFRIDPLQLISSGALLIAARPEFSHDVITRLMDNNIQAREIGEFVPNKNRRTLVCSDGSERPLPTPSSDHLWTALMQK